MVTNSLLSIALLLSFRTPKSDNPTDWLYMMEVKNKTIFANVAWERDNGGFYNEEEYSIQHVFFDHLKLKEYYVENFKQNYNQASAQYTQDWWSAGYAFQDGSSAIFETNWNYNNTLTDSLGSVYNLSVNITSGIVTEFKTVNARLSVKFSLNWFTIEAIARDIGMRSEYLQLQTGIKLKY